MIIPSSVTSVGDRAFFNCTGLTSLTLPDTITSIGTDAFRGCGGLTGTFTLPSGVTAITASFLQDAGYTEFRSQSTLTSITAISPFSYSGIKYFYFAEGLQTIGNYFLNNCNDWLYVDLPSTLTSIGQAAFGRAARTGDPILVVRATTPPTLGINSWTIAPWRIYVPYSSNHSILNAYKAATNWSTQASKMYELNSDGTVPA